MPMPAPPTRGVSNLRTLSNLGEKTLSSHKAFLRVSFLELERVRLTHEMQAARIRLALMMSRCLEIEAERESLLARVAPASTPETRPAPRGQAFAPRPRKRSFHLSY